MSLFGRHALALDDRCARSFCCETTDDRVCFRGIARPVNLRAATPLRSDKRFEISIEMQSTSSLIARAWLRRSSQFEDSRPPLCAAHQRTTSHYSAPRASARQPAPPSHSPQMSHLHEMIHLWLNNSARCITLNFGSFTRKSPTDLHQTTRVTRYNRLNTGALDSFDLLVQDRHRDLRILHRECAAKAATRIGVLELDKLSAAHVANQRCAALS